MLRALFPTDGGHLVFSLQLGQSRRQSQRPIYDELACLQNLCSLKVWQSTKKDCECGWNKFGVNELYSVGSVRPPTLIGFGFTYGGARVRTLCVCVCVRGSDPRIGSGDQGDLLGLTVLVGAVVIICGRN